MKRLRTYAPMAKVSDKQAEKNVEQRAVRAHVMERAGGRCEVELEGVRCPKRAWEPHHVTKRSAGGAHDPDNEIAICRDHHDRTDWPFPRGRLVVAALGGETFSCRIAFHKDR